MNDAEKNCPNCKKDVAAGNFMIHSAHCERKIRLCQLCDEPIPKNEFDMHLQLEHNSNNCSFCNLSFKGMMLKQHESECYKRPTYCQFCTCEFEYHELSEHELNCKLRTEENDNLVKLNHTHIARNDYKKKKEDLKVCKYCQLEYIPEKYLDHEIMCGSRTEKCSMCNKFVTRQDFDTHHCRKVIDRLTLITCKYCEEKYPETDIRKHEAICNFRGEKCFQCAELIPFQDLKDHHCKKVDFNKGMREECSAEIKFSDKILKGEQCQKMIDETSVRNVVSCPFCKVNFRQQDLASHEKLCPERIEVCLQCKKDVMLRDRLKHKNRCEMKSMSNFAECPICFEHVMGNELETHYNLCYRANTECAVDALENINNPFGSSKDFLQSSNQVLEDESSCPCPICNVEFPISCFQMHKETCIENSKKSEKYVKVKNEAKHEDTCQKKYRSSNRTLCSICHLPFEKKEFASHEEANFERYKVCPECAIEKKKDESAHKSDSPMQDMSNLEKCSICYEPLMPDKLKIHYDMCFLLNSAGATASVKKSTHHPDTGDHSSSLSNQANKQKRGNLNNKNAECPYCQKFVPRDNFDYHKKYCSEAIKTCQLCQENFHIKDEKHHTNTCDVLKNIDKKDLGFGDPSVPSYLRRQEKETTKDYHEGKKLDFALCKECPFCRDWYYKYEEKDHMLKCRKMDSGSFSGSGAKPKKKNKNKDEKPSGIMNSVKKIFGYFGHGNDYSSPSSVKNQYQPDTMIHNRNNKMEAPVMIPCEFCDMLLILNEEEILLHASVCPANECIRPPTKSDEQSIEIQIDRASKKERMYITGGPNESLSLVEPSQGSPHSKQTEIFTFMDHFNKKYSLDSKNQTEEDSKEKEIVGEPLPNRLSAEMEREKVAQEDHQTNEEETLCAPLLTNNAMFTQSREESPSALEKNYETFSCDKDIKYTKPGEFLKDGYYYAEVKEGDYSNKKTKPYLSKPENIGSNDMNKIRQKSYLSETFDSDSDTSTKNKCYSENSDDCYVRKESIDKAKSHLSKSFENTSSEMIKEKRPTKTYHLWEKFDCNSDKLYSDNMNDYCVSKESVDKNESHVSKPFEETSSKMINEIKPNKTYHLWETVNYNTDTSAGHMPDWKNVDNSNVFKNLESASQTFSNLSSSFNNHNSSLYSEMCLPNNECPDSRKNNSLKSSESMFNQYDSKEIESEDYSIVASSVMKGPIKIDRLSIKKTSIQQNKDLEKVETSELITEKISPGFNILHPEFIPNQHLKDYPLIDFRDNEGFTEIYADEKLNKSFERFKIHENLHPQNQVPYYEISGTENILANKVPEMPKSVEQPMDVDEENQDKRKYNMLLRGNFYSKNNNFSDAYTKENWEDCSNGVKTTEDSCNYAKQDETLSSDLSDSENMSDLDSYFRFLENKQPDKFTHQICQVCKNEICLCKIKESLSNETSFSYSETSSKDDSIETVKNDDNLNHAKNDLNLVFKSSSKQISASQNTDKNWSTWRELDTDSD